MNLALIALRFLFAAYDASPELDDSEPSVSCELTTHLDGRTVTTCEGRVTYVQDQDGNSREYLEGGRIVVRLPGADITL